MLENICNNTFSNTFDTIEWFLVMFAIIGQFKHMRSRLISIFSLINIIGSLNQRRENNGLSIGSRIMRNTK